MYRQRATNAVVTTTVTQPPAPNFRNVVATRMLEVSARPMPFTARRFAHAGSVARSCHQCTHIPSCESVNVKNTLML